MELTKRLALHYIQTRFKLLSRLSKKKAAEEAFRLFTTPQSRVKKELPPVFKKAEKLSFNFNGVTIQGFRFNHPSEKKLLILHGFESSVLNFDAYIQPLLKKGYEILAFDAPGHGLSGGRQINAVDYKNLILHVVKTYGPVTAFLTHSFGGLALGLALEELPHNESWKAVFIAPATESTTAMKHFVRIVKLDANTQKEFENLVVEANGKPLSWYSVARAAASIKAQVLFLQDKNDYITPLADVQPIVDKGYPNFRFVISEGLGHSKIYRDKQTVQTIVDFL
ncbi:alpha/beta hydrolase [Flavisolibacter ginsenosidimutans]|uniref:Alpha/beta hydrolase n=1 Tax=Flavisolibacter ginsenosidimutans TaxID=661481 RepID=A0A5B8UE50_9BACT|nr:alpha/beta hydrolase [Flavisolibacter ginsenosidimutans]QEC54947.1 alpha/beta hydrolase [Flavisolibacter ginsenosidimutans]